MGDPKVLSSVQYTEFYKIDIKKSRMIVERMYENKAGNDREKTLYYEICRIAAIFCIMYQHTGGRGVNVWMYTESVWVYWMSLVGRIVSSVGVPLFWMISGALLLQKKEAWKKVYGKRVPRIAGTLILFSVIRYLYLFMIENRDVSAVEFLRRFYTQEIFLPYWFLYEYLGILLVLPFLRKMMQNLTQREEQVLFALLLGWHVLNDLSNIFWNVGFMIDLHFCNSISYFIFGYLMENCRMLKHSDKKRLWFCAGQAVAVTGGVYIWLCAHQEAEIPVSVIMLLTIAVYGMIRHIGEQRIWDRTKLHRLVLEVGGNVFGIYLIEDYLRNGTAVIWEKLATYISAIPACVVWILAVFLIGNILISAARRLPVFRKIL